MKDKAGADKRGHRREMLRLLFPKLAVNQPGLEELGRRMAEDLERRVLDAFLGEPQWEPVVPVKFDAESPPIFSREPLLARLLSDGMPVLPDPRILHRVPSGEEILNEARQLVDEVESRLAREDKEG